MSKVLDNWSNVQAKIQAAASRAGRRPQEIEVVAVTKYAATEAVAELLRLGQVHHIGESRIQDAARKFESLAGMAEWPRIRKRMIGHLQTNKVRPALELFDTLDSLDSVHLAEALDSRLNESGRRLPVLVQVRLAESPAQHGARPEDLEDLIRRCRGLERLDVQGLMVIAPRMDPVEAVRPHFRRMKELLDRFFPASGPRILSMGMSRDFEIAVEEGATMLRLGSVLFAEG